MMYARKRKLSDSQEPACVLCGRGDVDRNIFGRTFDQIWFWVHEFCLLFANISFDESSTQEGTVGIDSAALTCKVKQANQKQCCVCGERGAAITCAESGCERSFHLPCAKDGQCVTQFFGWQRSFCWEHRPRQTAVTAPARGTTCVLCRQTVGNVASYHTLVCPVCKHAWFHRACVQQQALNEGIACFRCPACQDNTLFCIEMSILGIRIPDRTPEREDNRASAVVLQRHGHCDAVICFCAGGRDQAEEEGPWQLIPCSSCGAQSTHRECSYSSIRTNKWDCDRCAGLGTASSTIAQLAALSAASQQGLEPSHSPQEPEDSCSGPTIQPASGPSHTSQLLELSCQTSVQGTEQGTTCSAFPDHQDAPEQCQAPCGSSHTPTPGTGSSSRPSTAQGTLGSSRAATAAARRRRPRQRGTSRTRSRSPLQGRAPPSQSRTRRPQRSRRTPSPAAQKRTRSTSRPATRRTLRASLRPDSREWPRQPGEARMQSRSSVARRVPHVHSRH
ncbi:PHD finger protein 7-like isoform X3 [Gallus gallus]|uniref:PHD finger protein 7-like isoform X2 n=1 Tax=Gallus gallus TaxID=9031 RepID=UPI001AE5E952|nr:PHD finger protein 7-like isoform X2 [Gallus gallus]XP_046765552.1 PHD finger protein 7-like isoform X3 [Gallus gallus]